MRPRVPGEFDDYDGEADYDEGPEIPEDEYVDAQAEAIEDGKKALRAVDRQVLAEGDMRKGIWPLPSPDQELQLCPLRRHFPPEAAGMFSCCADQGSCVRFGGMEAFLGNETLVMVNCVKAEE